jgi:hypothetical protein
MKPTLLKTCLAAATLGLTAMSFSELGTPAADDRPLVAAPDEAAPGPLAEGYFIANGASYFTRNGQVFRVEREVSLRVLPNAMLGFNGQPLNLPPGTMLTTDGRHAPIPPGINPRALPGAADRLPGSPQEASVPRPEPAPVTR